MIATENFDPKSEKIENNQSTSNIESQKLTDTNVKSSNSSSVPSVSSSSFNSFVNSPNTSTSSSPTNKESNYKKKIPSNHNSNYNDPLLNYYQSNYGYYMPPLYGFENIPMNDLSNPLINPYYEYAQQLFGFSNYPTYIPADFSQNWNGNSTTKQNDNRQKDKSFSQRTNQNTSSNPRKFRKPFSKRGENEKPEEQKPVIPTYDLMKSEQVYVSAYPALPTNNEKIEQETIETNENKENESCVSKTAENTQTWSEKKWSEIVTGNKMFNNEAFFNTQTQPVQVEQNDEISLEQKVNELKLDETEINGESNFKKYDKTYNKKSNYKKDKYNQNNYYPSINNQNFDYYLQQQFFNDYRNYNTPKLDFDKSILDQLNPSEFNYNGEKEGVKESKFFVIKSNSREDVLRSIKHNIWCSTKYGNSKLNQAFSEKQNHPHMSIYLFFSINTSGMFSGMAEMISQVDFEAKTDVWTQDKWRGKIEIKWIYVKDVPNSKLKHITLPNNENKPVTHSRDAQEIPFDKGVEMLDVFRTYKQTSTLFDNPVDYYQAENMYMYNLMMNHYSQQTKYSKYHYKSSDYKWKNTAQNGDAKRPKETDNTNEVAAN